MNILFIGREKRPGQLSTIISAQAQSLVEAGVEVDYFCIEGSGLKGYLKSFFRLKKVIKTQTCQVYHAHYYASAILATVAGARPLAVSLMGSDVQSAWIRAVVNFFNHFFWSACIVKSREMYRLIKKNSHNHIIPNGVDLKVFLPLDRNECIKKLGFDALKKHVLFLADKARREKNYKLALEAFELLADPDVVMHAVNGIKHEEVPVYMSASDVLLLTSFFEGSPNVVKEAMACNLPVVSTPVGDVKEVFGETDGCYLTGFNAQSVSGMLRKALSFNGRTNGRASISNLDSISIARRLINIYQLLNR